MEWKHIKSSHAHIVLAGLVDAALIICLFVFSSKFLSSISFFQSNPNFSIFLGFILYRIITIMIFSATLGMMLFGMKFLNAEGRKIRLNEKLLASVFILFRGVDYYRVVRAFV